MNFIHNLLNSTDGNTDAIIKQLQNILMPIVYSITGAVLLFIIVRESLKIMNDAENKSKYIKNIVIAVIAAFFIFSAEAVVNYLLPKFFNN